MVGIRESFLLGVRPLFRCELLVVSFREGNQLEVSEDKCLTFFLGGWVSSQICQCTMVYLQLTWMVDFFNGKKVGTYTIH